MDSVQPTNIAINSNSWCSIVRLREGEGKGSLQSLDWNGGMEWWNHKFSKNKVKRSQYCVLLVSEGIHIIQIDSSLTNYTQKRYEMITCLDKMLCQIITFELRWRFSRVIPQDPQAKMAWLWSAIKIVMFELEILWGSRNFLASTQQLYGGTPMMIRIELV